MTNRCFYILVVVTLLFCSCISQLNHHYYQQNPPEVSLFTEKGEVKAAAYMGISSNTNSKGFQASCSITEKFCVAISGNIFSNSKSESANGQSTGSWNGNYFEGAFGYYKDLKKLGIVEVYAGFGNGRQEHKYANVQEAWGLFTPTYTITQIGSAVFNYNKFYVQPAYGFSFFNSFDMGVYARVSYFDFYNVKNDIKKGYNDHNSVNYIRNDPGSFMIEPGVTLRAGYKFIKFQMQFCFTSSSAVYNYDGFCLGLGVQFSFANKYSKKKEEKQEAHTKYTPME